MKPAESRTYNPAADNAELILVDDDADQVSCDGGGGALGHPVVWYNFGKTPFAECLYCDRVFVKKSATDAVKRKPGKKVK